MQETCVGSTKLVTDMHVNYLTPEKLYLFTNLELPKICVIFTACLKILNTEIYNEDRYDEICLLDMLIFGFASFTKYELFYTMLELLCIKGFIFLSSG